MGNALETKPPEIHALIEALLPRKSFFVLKARLLKGVRTELKAARESGLTWLAIWTSLRDAGYPGSYQQFCKAASSLVEPRRRRSTKSSEYLLPSDGRKEVHQAASQVVEPSAETKEKPEWQRRREETMARLDREAEANLEREGRSSKPKKFTMTPFVGGGQE
jgi:hypothetical protein